MAKICTVDDSCFQVNQLSRSIKELGHEVYSANSANSAKDGFEIIKKISPDCLITDLLMPEIDGIEFVKMVRENGYKLPIIVLTANIQKSVKEECLEAGANSFLQKPPDKELLKETLEKLLSGQEGS